MMPSLPASPSLRLAELIGQKHEVLAQLCALGRRQLDFIDAGDMSQLFKVLAAKQRLLTLLQTVERDLQPFRDEDPNARPWPSPEARRACAERHQQCESLLAEILRQEKDSEQRMRLRRDEAAQQLQGLHHAAATRAAYAEESRPITGQLDLNTEH